MSDDIEDLKERPRVPESDPLERSRHLASPPRTDLYARSYALIVGVSAYRHTPSMELPEVEKDVTEVESALSEHGFEISVVRDPDHQELDRAFKSFLLDGKIEWRDRLLVYYAGHGHTHVSPHGVPTGYLLPVDAPSSDDPELRMYAMPLGTIHELSHQTSANHVLFLFDSCFSGQLLERPSSRSLSVPAYIEEHARRPVRQFITSGEADEAVPDRSIFRQQFVQALKGEADYDDDGFFTGSQLASYLFDKVVTLSRKSQHPQYGKSTLPELNKGDFVFSLPPKWILARAEVPEPPPSRPDFSSLEHAAADAERHYKTRRQQWTLHVQAMERDFKEGLQWEQRAIPNRLKILYWQRFLSGYSAECPFSDRDQQFREEARQRIEILERQQEHSGGQTRTGPGETLVDKRLGIRFRSIPAGRFRMGSPKDEHDRNDDETQHEVQLTRGFWIAETPVTQGQWESLMGDNPSHFADCGDECPVESVSWFSAVLFANRLSESAGIEPCYELVGFSELPDGREPQCECVIFLGFDCSGYRLPTEAEWEYAARAGRETPFWTGEHLTTDQANFDGTFSPGRASSGIFRQRTIPVRSFEPNPWGLYDAHGNVAEWVWDAYGDYPTDLEVDPVRSATPSDSPASEQARVIRGGGWLDDAASCRAADRLPAAPGYRDSNVGFRLTRSLREDDESLG